MGRSTRDSVADAGRSPGEKIIFSRGGADRVSLVSQAVIITREEHDLIACGWMPIDYVARFRSTFEKKSFSDQPE